MQPGSELAWAGVFVPQTPGGMIGSRMFASDMLKSLAYARPRPPGWDLSQFRFTTATLEGLLPTHGLYDATDPDLCPFARRGGRLLVYHGWSDPHISPLNSVAYAQAVTDRLDADAAAGRGRTLYPWPATSVLAAGADPDRPASWRAGPPSAAPARLYAGWAGAGLFASGYRQACGFDGFTFACRPAR